MNQVPVIRHSVPVIPDIPKGKSTQPAFHGSMGDSFVEDPGTRSSGSKSHYESESDVQQPEDHGASEDEH